MNLKEPENVDELERICGIFSYVAESIHCFADRIIPLRSLLTLARQMDEGRRKARRGGKRPSMELFPLQQPEVEAFLDLKAAMESPEFISTFEPGKEAILVVDGSQTAVGGALYQLNDQGLPKLKGLFSKALQDAQTRWKVFDIESLALVTALRRWEHLLRPERVKVVSDHKGLSALFRDSPRLDGKSARWVAELLP